MSRILIGVDTWSYHRALDPLPGEGPMRTLEDLLPRILTTHLRDHHSESVFEPGRAARSR